MSNIITLSRDEAEMLVDLLEGRTTHRAGQRVDLASELRGLFGMPRLPDREQQLLVERFLQEAS